MPPTILALRLAVLLLLLRTTGACLGTSRPDELPEHTVILVSIDGFRWDYLDRLQPPALKRLAAEGVHAERLIPVFPTKTFPAHFSLVTGLYPENHGVVGNSMYDPEFDARFSLGDREAVEDSRWWEGEPIWVTAEKQGMRSATFFWPGSESEIDGVRPSYWTPYDGRIPGEERVEQVLEWLDLPDGERPRLITLYFSEVDSRSHRHGPLAAEVMETVTRVDEYMAMLIAGIEERGVDHRVNIIVVSDHGMAQTSPDRVIVLDDHIHLDDVLVFDSIVLHLQPAAERDDAVYNTLANIPHLSVYRRDEIPERLHFRSHRRIAPIIAIAEEGWVITTRQRYEDNPSGFNGGAHGYDNTAESMAGLFIAHGPAFKKGVRIESFDSIDLYNMMTSILGLEPAPNDGAAGAGAAILSTQVRQR